MFRPITVGVVSDIRNKMAANHQAVQSQVSLEWEREKKEMSDTISTLQDTLSQSQRSKQEVHSHQRILLVVLELLCSLQGSSLKLVSSVFGLTVLQILSSVHKLKELLREDLLVWVRYTCIFSDACLSHDPSCVLFHR